MICDDNNLLRCQHGKTKAAGAMAWRTTALAGMLGVTFAVMGAQVPTTQAPTPAPPSSATTEPAGAQALPTSSSLRTSAANGAFSSSSLSSSSSLFSSSSSDFSSSSSEIEAASPVTEARMTPLPSAPAPSGMMKSSGASGQNNYRYRYHAGGNSDGSDRWIFYGGGGITEPIANTHQYLTDNFAIQAGGGYQFNQRFSLPIEFDWDQFGMTKQNLDNEITIYDEIFGSATFNGILDGSSHIWSFAVEPRYSFNAQGSWNPYVLGGVGFYHKAANFTIPAALAAACSGYGGFGGYGYGYGGYGGYNGYGVGGDGAFCGAINVGRYTSDDLSDAPGLNFGGGISHRLSDTRVSFYAEARYIYILNSAKRGITMSNYTDTPYKTTNLYPANSYHTDYIPITFGIRF